MKQQLNSNFPSKVAGMALALFGLCGPLGLGWTGEAQAATSVIIDGPIDFITVNDMNDHWSGGTIQVGGQTVTIPKNLLMDLPANRLTLQEFMLQAPAFCVPLQQSGIARGDSPLCNTAGMPGFALIHANRTSAGNTIAGDVFLQKGVEAIQGTVTFINFNEGFYRLNGNLNDPTTGVMVRINDPDGRHTVQSGAGCVPGSSNCSADPRFTLDPDNYTNVFTTGYPLCIPSRTSRSFVDVLDLNTNNNTTETLVAQALPDGTGDLLCPTTNRTVNGGLPVDDSRRLAPIMLGDSMTAEGNFERINGVRFLSAWSTMVSKALTTKNLPDQPDYIFLDEVELDVAGFQNQRARGLFIGFATLGPEDVLLWSLHYDPTTNARHELPLASVLGCNLAAGPGTCGAQGIVGVSNIWKIRYDIDFLAGANLRLNPCAHLLADPRMGGAGICPGGAGNLNTVDMLGIVSPIPHEIQARTGHALANPGLITLDINGNEAANGQYLFPFGIGLGGIGIPEFVEINLDAIATPIMFSGIPWNLDRRLSPGGCDGPCEGTPQPLDPFPFEQLDPRLQASLPIGQYTSPVFTSTPLTDVRNRVLSFVDNTGKANGNATVLTWPPVNPGGIPITPTTEVPGANVPPTITSSPVLTARAGFLYTYDVDATDPNGDTLTYTLENSPPSGMTINSTTGLITWTPTQGQAPTQGFSVKVIDTGGLYDKQAIVVKVNGAPSFVNVPAPSTAKVGVLYVYQPFATDPNLPNDTLTYALVIPPSGTAPLGTTTFNPTTGRFTWTPSAGQVGARSFTLRVIDSLGASQLRTFNVTVAP